MGIITELIREHHQRDLDAKLAESQALRTVLDNAPTSEAKEWALQGLNQLAMGKPTSRGGAGGKGKAGGASGAMHPAISLLGALSGLNPFSAGKGTKSNIADIESRRPGQGGIPGRLSVTNEDVAKAKAQEEIRRSDLEQARQIAVQKAELKNRQQLEKEFNEQQTKERLQAFDSVADRLYKDPEQRARARFTVETGITLPKDEKMIVGEAKNVTAILPTAPGQPGQALSVLQEIQPDGKPVFYGPDGNQINLPRGTEIRIKAPAGETDKGTLGELESAFVGRLGPNATPQQIEKAKNEARSVFIRGQVAGASEKSTNAAFNAFMARGAGVPGLGGLSGGGGTPPYTPAPGATGATAPARVPTSPVQQKNINEFIFRSLNPGMPGRDKYTSARMQDGLNSLMAQTGLSAEQLTASLQERKDEFKALNQTIDKYRAYQILEERLKADGNLLKQARTKLPDAKLRLLNQAIVSGLTQVNDPEVNKYLVAVNALSRTYSIAVSNGFQSRAMPPVTNMQEANKLISPALSNGAIDAIVDQLGAEVKANSNAIGNVWREQVGKLSTPLGAVTGPPQQQGTQGVPNVGDMFNGQKVLKVEKVQ